MQSKPRVDKYATIDRELAKKRKKNPKKTSKKSPPATATVDAQHRLWVYETVNSVLCATWRQIKNLASNQQFYVKSRNLRHWPLFKRLVCRVRLQSVLSIDCGSHGGDPCQFASNLWTIQGLQEVREGRKNEIKFAKIFLHIESRCSTQSSSDLRGEIFSRFFSKIEVWSQRDGQNRKNRRKSRRKRPIKFCFDSINGSCAFL